MSQEQHIRPNAGDQAVAILRQLDGLKTDEPRVANVGERLFARAFDFLLWVLVVFGLFDLGLVAWLALTGDLKNPDKLMPQQADPTVATIFGVVMVVAAFLYCTVPLVYRGQTVGKRLMGLVVVGENGTDVTWPQAVRRFVAWEGPGIVLVAIALPTTGAISTIAGAAGFAWSAAILLPSLLDEERRTWADRFAGTRVVRPR